MSSTMYTLIILQHRNTIIFYNELKKYSTTGMTYLKALNNLFAVFTWACWTHNTLHYHNWSLLFTSVSVYACNTGGQHITRPHAPSSYLFMTKSLLLQS